MSKKKSKTKKHREARTVSSKRYRVWSSNGKMLYATRSEVREIQRFWDNAVKSMRIV